MATCDVDLDFDYCECGCKGYSASLGEFGYWIFWDLKRQYMCTRGHGFSGVSLGIFGSMKDAKQAANKDASIRLKSILKGK